jgi:subtilisin family serine protease
VTTRHFRNVPASAARAGAGARAFLQRHPEVLSVVPDREVEKLGKPTSSGSVTAAQVVPSGVMRVGAQPGAVAFTGAGVGVAIVDTGIDFQHADFKDGNRTVVAATCFSVYAACQDDEGHGTHVAGIVAAANNEFDVVGVAPDATLYAVKVLDHRGRGSDSTIMAGLDWITNPTTQVSPAIHVVNMSLGRRGTLDDNPALRASVQAVVRAGITVVVAAGNDSTLEVSDQVPATYPEVIAVASTTATAGSSACGGHPSPVSSDTASYFTTDGAFDSLTGIGVSVSAPGEDREDINRSCFLRSVGILSTRLGGGTVRMSGTSMAAPHVAGVVAMMGSAVTPDDARRRLRLGADGASIAPLDPPAGGYSFDGEREGVVWAPGALSAP